MFPLAGVGVLIAGRAVELIQAEGVLGEVGRDPVQNDADASLMELIHQILEIIRGAIAAGGGKIAGALIAPGVVQGMFTDRKKLHVGEAHLFYVGDQIMSDIPIAEELVLAGARQEPRCIS